jgi:uncharacterized Zn-binding protein involved in type VI secretion
MRRAARVSDFHICPLAVPSPHIGGPILPPGALKTTFNGKAAARVTDKAFCIAPAPDTVRGGLLSVFIEGNPASRVFDRTDVGMILVGSPDVMLGEWKPQPLTPEQAQWLYDYMAAQSEIPFEYPNDGCFARADRMAVYMENLGIPVQKQWVRAKGWPYLRVPISNYNIEELVWGYHVAPVVSVTSGGGNVIDPSLGFGMPVSVDEWIGAQTSDLSTVFTYTTPSDVYFTDLNGHPSTMRNDATTAENLAEYREAREGLPEWTDRRRPAGPVHF